MKPSSGASVPLHALAERSPLAKKKEPSKKNMDSLREALEALKKEAPASDEGEDDFIPLGKLKEGIVPAGGTATTQFPSQGRSSMQAQPPRPQPEQERPKPEKPKVQETSSQSSHDRRSGSERPGGREVSPQAPKNPQVQPAPQVGGDASRTQYKDDNFRSSPRTAEPQGFNPQQSGPSPARSPGSDEQRHASHAHSVPPAAVQGSSEVPEEVLRKLLEVEEPGH
jgi:hypothetical protein